MAITFPFFKGARVSSPDVWLWVASIVLVLVGLAGTVLPALPGPPLVFGGLLVVGLENNF